ncbi:hypothetical protein [Alkalihalophilus pseudofirmus]
MIYTLSKRVIESGHYEYNSMLNKLDVYLLGDRIDPDQYKELKDLMDTRL